jgi:hypothetical protein
VMFSSYGGPARSTWLMLGTLNLSEVVNPTNDG